MAKLQTLSKEEIKQIILDAIKKQQPETTQQLISWVHEKTGLPSEQITKVLIQLENEDKLHFTKKEPPLPQTYQDYILSKKAAWYWITVALAIGTTVAVFTIPDDAYPVVYLRLALGTLFVLFLPGFAFIKMLFPTKIPLTASSENMETIERVALSLGLSIALVPLVGVVLNYTPWGIRLVPITLALLALTAIFATVAIFREYQTKANPPRNQTIIS